MDATVRDWRAEEARVQHLANLREEQDRWVKLAKYAMEQARRVAHAAAEWLELTEES